MPPAVIARRCGEDRVFLVPRAALLVTGDQLFALGKRRLAEAGPGVETNHDPPSAA